MGPGRAGDRAGAPPSRVGLSESAITRKKRLSAAIGVGLALVVAALGLRMRAPGQPATRQPRRQAQPQPEAASTLRQFLDAELAALQQPTSAELALRAGSLAADQGRHLQALRWFRRSAELDPNLVPALAGQGQMWMELGRPGLAAEAYRRAQALLPAEPQLLLELARAYTYMRDFRSALDFAARAEKLAPQMPEVQRALATVYADVMDPELSLRHAVRACELGPDDAENWSTQGALLIRQRRYAAAEGVLRRALSLDSAHVEANVLLARATMEGKDPQADREAYALLSRARLIRPAHAEALRMQAAILSRAGDTSQAVQLLREARELEPEDSATLLALGQALIRAGKGEEGVRLVSVSQRLPLRGVAFLDLEELARDNPDPEIALRLADLYVRHGLVDSAIWVLNRARKRSPGHARLSQRLAAVLESARVNWEDESLPH